MEELTHRSESCSLCFLERIEVPAHSAVPAVGAAIEVLQYLAEHGPSRARRMTLNAGLNPSTGHNILKTLAHGGLLNFDEQTKLYSLGPALSALAAKAWAGAVDRVEGTMLKRWVAETGFTVYLARLLPNGDIIIVDKAESLDAVKVTVGIGERFSLSSPAVGRAFLAWFDDAEQERILKDLPLPAYTERAIKSKDEFRAELRRTRDRGWAEARGEYYSYSNAVATPVLDPRGNPAFVVGSLGARTQMLDADLEGLGKRIVGLAKRIQEQMWTWATATAR